MDDFELLEAWRGGDEAAGERLFARHFDAVARFFRNKITEAPDDLVQETFLGAVQGRARIQQDAFRPFLFGVANNVLRNYFRARRRGGVAVDFSVDSAFGLVPSPSAVVARQRTQQLLLEGLRRIPLQYQVALELHYWEDATAADLAAAVDIPVGTAKTRLKRGKELLLEALVERLGAGEQGDALTDAAALDEQVRGLRTLVLR